MANDQGRVPPDMREFAEQGLEQARTAFETMALSAQRAVSAWEGQAASARAGAQDVARKAMGFAGDNMTASLEFARQVAAARDPDEVMRLHAAFVKAQMETLAAQCRDLGTAAVRMTATPARD